MADDGSNPERVHFAYFVHDVTDAAVARRVRMLEAGGATVTVLGFRRRGEPRARIGNAPVIDLGMTGDSKLLRRIGSVIGVVLRPGKVRAAMGPNDILIARNLETLVIARALGGQRRIVFECLDIHRLLVGTGPASRALRTVERWALRKTRALVISSPRFLTEHFAGLGVPLPEVLLVENRLLTLDADVQTVARRPRSGDAPWVIGWFGMLRCARTLAILKGIVARGRGKVRVLIAGIPTPAVFPDFAADVAAVPEFEFVGRYAEHELPGLYARVDFAWTPDFFEEGLNSTWLLPNRLYESLAHGAVPVALAGTETAHWLSRHAVGCVIDDPEQGLSRILETIAPAQYDALRHAVAALPPETTRAGIADCRQLVADLSGRQK